MSRKPRFNEKQIDHYRGLLQKIMGEGTPGIEPGSPGGDVIDMATHQVSSRRAMEDQERSAVIRNAAEYALGKIEGGTYGTCEGCNHQIPKTRLNVIPYATLCIKCQEEVEQDQEGISTLVQ